MTLGLLLAAGVMTSPPQGGVLPGEQVEYDAMVATQARAANKTFSGSGCDDARIEVVSITPAQISDHPDLIVWREKVRVSGCGHSAVENLNVGRLGGRPPWRITTGLPGYSLADMNLQSSTFPAAAAQAKAGLPADCQAESLADVYVAARPGGVDIVLPGAPARAPVGGRPTVTIQGTTMPLDKLQLSGAWMEVWPFEACSHDRTLGVVFIPLKDGTASQYLFLPVWQQIEAHGPGARPAAVPWTDEGPVSVGFRLKVRAPERPLSGVSGPSGDARRSHRILRSSRARGARGHFASPSPRRRREGR